MPSTAEVRLKDQAPSAPSWSSVLRYAAPGILLATILLVPFFGKAYTIDDPFFLRKAEHAWHDPLHPTAFEIVWNQEVPQRASTLLPGGPLVPFLLLPVQRQQQRRPTGCCTDRALPGPD